MNKVNQLTKFSIILFVVIVAFFSYCTTSHKQLDFFSLTTDSKQKPWSHEKFDNNSGDFRFAIVSDLYGGYREGIFDVALEQINLMRPEFILSVGDLIDGGTEDRTQLTNEWDVFDDMLKNVRAPFFYTGGNHDLTNVVMRDVWKERYGRRYYHFKYKNVLFLILDSEDYEEQRMQEIYEARAIAIEIMDGKREGNAATSEYFKMEERRTGNLGNEQLDYFEKVIQKNSDVEWTFLLMHKPVWMGKSSGNLDRIEAALDKHPYTVINGHFHTYSHTIRKGRDYIMLGTTGGSQNDQSAAAFDHFSFVTMTKQGPSIAQLKLEGVLNKEGKIPNYKEGMCFSANACMEE